MKPFVSVQILNWNRAIETQRAIKSALDQSYSNIEIIVVDNGSTDNSVELTRRNFPMVTLVELGKNYGCPGGRNLGINYCNGDYIFYLDNDGILHRDAVKNAISSISNGNNIAIVTGTVYAFTDIEEIDLKCEIRNNSKYYHNNFQGGICMHDKRIYKQIGVYPSHFMYGAEETFLTLKLFQNSYNIIKDESVILWHKRSDIARDRTNEILSGYFNKLYIAISLFPLIRALIFLIYFLIKYPIYAYQEGLLSAFVIRFKNHFFPTIIKAYKERKPISPHAFSRYYNFKISRDLLK